MGTATEMIVERVIFFDGVCNLCNSSVNFVLDHDRIGKFKFASLQSDYARTTLAEFGLNALELESIVLKKGTSLYKKSDAVLEVTRGLGGAWQGLYVLKVFPRFFRDWVYDFIAKRRYKWFGKKDSCRVPTPELQERFLGS